MTIPLRSHELKLAQSWPKYIILHHTGENADILPSAIRDKGGFQAGAFQDFAYNTQGQINSGYHFIIDMIGSDYYALISQPLLTYCEWEDMDDEFQAGIHIAIMGDYNIQIAKNRLYQILAFRLLFPLTRMFAIHEDSILFHSDVTNDNSINCPGEFISRDRVLSYFRSINRRKPLRRK